MHIEAHSAPELIAAGVPADLFTGLQMDGFRVSTTGKLHRQNDCFHVKSTRFRLRPATMPLRALSKARCCECVHVLDLPDGASARMKAAAATLAVSDAAADVRYACQARQRPKLTHLATLVAARDTRLTDELETLRVSQDAAQWHAEVLTEAAAALALLEETFGADPHREARHAAHLVLGTLFARFDPARHPALNADVGIGPKPQSSVVGPAQSHLSDGLREGAPRDEIRERVLAVVDEAVPTTVAQIPDVPADPTLGAQAAAVAVWRAQARKELAELVDEALAEFDTLTADTDEVLVVVDGDLEPDHQALLSQARVLGTRDEQTAYAVPGVIATALGWLSSWRISAGRVALPADERQQRDFAAALLALLESGMSTEDAVTAAAGVSAPAACAVAA